MNWREKRNSKARGREGAGANEGVEPADLRAAAAGVVVDAAGDVQLVGDVVVPEEDGLHAVVVLLVDERQRGRRLVQPTVNFASHSHCAMSMKPKLSLLMILISGISTDRSGCTMPKP